MTVGLLSLASNYLSTINANRVTLNVPGNGTGPDEFYQGMATIIFLTALAALAYRFERISKRHTRIEL